MKVPSSLRAGLVALLTAITLYAAPVTWIKTRNFYPLDVPLTLSDSHFHSPEFKISRTAPYFIGFYDLSDQNPPYTFCYEQTWQDAKWKVFKGGRPVAVNHESRSGLPSAGEFTGQVNDSFDAGPGNYSIDLQLDSPPECLKFTKMRLQVITSQGKYWSHYLALCGICLVLGGIGIALMIQGTLFSIPARSIAPTGKSPLISQSPGYACNFGTRKRRRAALFHGLPDFGVLYFAAMFPCLIAMLILLQHSGSMGIKTHLVRPNGIHAHADPRSKALLVWLDAHGNYFVNDKQAAHDDFGDALKRELSQPAEWTVYFEADGDASFGDSVFAMSVIRNAAGKVVWLTPKTRQEFAAQDPTK
jgi:biopolymer transport protein ExbD